MKNPHTRSPRATFVQTGRAVKVVLTYGSALFGRPYQISKITNEIAVVVDSKSAHVGDYLTEQQATDLLTEPALEISVVPAKE